MKRILFSILLIILTTVTQAREKNEATFYAGLSAYGSEPTYNLELSYSYFFLPNIGVTGGIEYIDNYDRYGGFSTEINGRKCEIKDEDARIQKFSFNFLASFKTPIVWLNRKHESGLIYHCDPGICISIPWNDRVSLWEIDQQHPFLEEVTHTVNNHNGQVMSWKVRNRISYRIPDAEVSIGYTISNFDLFGGRRNMKINNRPLWHDLPSHKFTHTVFVSVSYIF